MTIKFILLGLVTEQVVLSAWLSSDGVQTEKKSVLHAVWESEHDTYEAALIAAEKLNYPEGIEIKQVLFKK